MATGVPHLMTLADLSAPQINRVLAHSLRLKQLSQPLLLPRLSIQQSRLRGPFRSLSNKTIALLFSKRSTRTRLSAETAAVLLGGHALFLGRDDIQLGVNETLPDTAQVISGMCQGIFARVGDHRELEVRRSALLVLDLCIDYSHIGAGETLQCSCLERAFFIMAPNSNISGSPNAP
jgi:ornithine carbamoyltransferase